MRSPRPGEASGPEGARPLLMVGFNRRFAPHVEKMQSLLAGVREPKTFVMTVNAGAIPASTGRRIAAVGGGRIVGEACHFIDLLRFLAGEPDLDARLVGAAARSGAGPVDSVTITLAFADGSIGTIHYLANGHSSFPKERLEVFCAGRVLQLDNFRRLRGYGWPGFVRSSSGDRTRARARARAHRRGAARERVRRRSRSRRSSRRAARRSFSARRRAVERPVAATFTPSATCARSRSRAGSRATRRVRAACRASRSPQAIRARVRRPGRARRVLVAPDVFRFLRSSAVARRRPIGSPRTPRGSGSTTCTTSTI